MRNTPQKTAIVWTDSENRAGIKAAALLRRTGAKVEVRDINSRKWKKSDVAAAVPGYTSLPQVVVDGTIIGDLAAVKAHPELGAKLTKPKVSREARVAKLAENRENAKTARALAISARVEASKSNVMGRQSNPTDDQRTAALARAETAKAARAQHAAARVAAIKAARG